MSHYVNPSFVLLVAGFIGQGTLHAAALSQYTGVDIAKDCVVATSSELDQEPEIDHLEAECPGLGGYRVFVTGGDIRYGITLGYGSVQMPLDRMGAFHDLGSQKVEWVYERPDERAVDGITQLKYLALIHRISYQDNVETGHNTTRLYVTKLAGAESCVVGVVEASSKMNEIATAMGAKAQQMPCIKPEW